jgi:hypothetical protein
MPGDAELPSFATRDELARHISATRFSISRRTIERWPISVRTINGRTRLDTAKALAYADVLIASAPAVARGRPLRRRPRLSIAKDTETDEAARRQTNRL